MVDWCESRIWRTTTSEEGFPGAASRWTARIDWAGERRAEEAGLGAGLVDDARSLLRERHKVSLPEITLEQLLTNSRSWIHGLTGKLKGKPLLDMVGGVIEDYEFLWDQYYFPTATL